MKSLVLVLTCITLVQAQVKTHMPTPTPAPIETATPAPIETATPAPIETATPAPNEAAAPATIETAAPTLVDGAPSIVSSTSVPSVASSPLLAGLTATSIPSSQPSASDATLVPSMVASTPGNASTMEVEAALGSLNVTNTDATVSGGVASGDVLSGLSETERSAVQVAGADDAGGSAKAQDDGSFKVRGSYGTLNVKPDGKWTYDVDKTSSAVKHFGTLPDTLYDVFSFTVAGKDGSAKKKVVQVVKVWNVLNGA